MDRENRRRHRDPALSARILAGSLLLSVVAACGQRGPLYLPTPPAEPPARAAARAPGTAPPVVSPLPGTRGNTAGSTPRDLPAGGAAPDGAVPRRAD